MISDACGAMYWKSDQMFVCKLEGKDVPELAVPREVSEPTPGRIRRIAVSLRKESYQAPSRGSENHLSLSHLQT